MCRTAFGYHAGPTVNISFFIRTKTMNESEIGKERRKKPEETLINCAMYVIKVYALRCNTSHIYFIDVSYRFMVAVLFHCSKRNMNGGREHKDYISCRISINHIEFEC